MNDERPADRDDPRWLISALVDGEADAEESGREHLRPRERLRQGHVHPAPLREERQARPVR